MRWSVYASAMLALVCLAMPAFAQPVAPKSNDAGVEPHAPGPAPDAPVIAAPALAPAPATPVMPSEPATAEPSAAAPVVEVPSAAPPPAVQPQPPAAGGAPQSAEPATLPTPPPLPPPRVARTTPPDAGGSFEQRGKSIYLRLAVGFGIPVGPDIADNYAMRGDRALHFIGGSFASDWMGGGMLLPWLAVGLGAASDTIVGGSVHYADNSKHSLASSLYYFVLGPFADVYFSPPAGWHVQALLGVAHISRADDLSHGATGFGAVLGVGYDVAVAPRWNVGALARLAISPLSMSATAGEKPSPTVYEPGLLFTATFRPAR